MKQNQAKQMWFSFNRTNHYTFLVSMTTKPLPHPLHNPLIKSLEEVIKECSLTIIKTQKKKKGAIQRDGDWERDLEDHHHFCNILLLLFREVILLHNLNHKSLKLAPHLCHFWRWRIDYWTVSKMRLKHRRPQLFMASHLVQTQHSLCCFLASK